MTSLPPRPSRPIRLVFGSVSLIGLAVVAYAVVSGEFCYRGRCTLRSYEPYAFWWEISAVTACFALVLYVAVRRTSVRLSPSDESDFEG
jgi:hypothetical protein